MLEDDRFTDTISRNTSVQSAIERFDHRRPVVVQNRARSTKATSPEGTTNVLTYDDYHGMFHVQPVPLPRNSSSSSSSPPLESTSTLSTTSNKPLNLTREESLKFHPTTTELIHPAGDDVIYHPMKPPAQSSRLSHIGAGITGMYQQQTLTTSMSEDDSYEDEMDVITARKDSAPPLPNAPLTLTDSVQLSTSFLMKQVRNFFIRAS
uniref:Uncharacterized protein n=1 Tax=Angiostrongylus cantonensis TaxID=6313 RepID=A0A0K0DI17_ANGCA